MATRSYGKEELDAVTRWLDTNQDSESEKMHKTLEEKILADYPVQRLVLTNSAMGALHLALQTIGVGPGDEVIVDPIVVFAGMAAMYHNAVPVFADIHPRTFNMDPSSLEKRITERTRAIICTHHFGSLCDMDAILRIAEKHKLPVIEDCAHALFATQNGKKAGLFGDFSAFSFNHRKQLSTGQGGFLLINSAEWAEKSKDKGFGRVPARLTWNYAMPGVIAGLAAAQWDRAKAYVQRDHELAQLFFDAIKGCSWLIPQDIPANNWSAFHIWAAEYRGDTKGISQELFMKTLKENGADYFLPSFIPMGAFGLEPSPAYRYPIFSEPKAYNLGCPVRCPHYKGAVDYRKGLCPNAEHLVPRLLNTVLSPIQDDRVKRYAEGLKKTVQYFSKEVR